MTWNSDDDVAAGECNGGADAQLIWLILLILAPCVQLFARRPTWPEQALDPQIIIRGEMSWKFYSLQRWECKKDENVRRGESVKRGEKRCENGRIWQRLSHKTLEYSTNLHLTTGKRGFFWWFNKGIPALRNHIISTPIWEQEGNKDCF